MNATERWLRLDPDAVAQMVINTIEWLNLKSIHLEEVSLGTTHIFRIATRLSRGAQATFDISKGPDGIGHLIFNSVEESAGRRRSGIRRMVDVYSQAGEPMPELTRELNEFILSEVIDDCLAGRT